MNDGVPKELCSMSYVSVDDAVRKILDSGPGSMLAKIDIYKERISAYPGAPSR